MREETTMSEQARALVLRHHDEIWSRGNLAAVDEVYAPEFVGHQPAQRPGGQNVVSAGPRALG